MTDKNMTMTLNLYRISNMTRFLEKVDRCTKPVQLMLGGDALNIKEDATLRKLLMQLSNGAEYTAPVTLKLDRSDACEMLAFAV